MCVRCCLSNRASGCGICDRLDCAFLLARWRRCFAAPLFLLRQYVCFGCVAPGRAVFVFDYRAFVEVGCVGLEQVYEGGAVG